MTLTTLDLAGIGPNDLILTPNRRLSAWLAQDFNDLMRQSGRLAWHRLNALPLDTWLLNQYETLTLINSQASSYPRLLSQQQSRLLWQQQLAGVMEEGSDQEGVAQLCIQARNLVCRWQLEEAHWYTGETEENRVFGTAHQRYLKTLQQENWIDQAGLAQWVVRISEHQAQPLERVFLHGFNDQTEPQLVSIRTSLERAGVRVHFSGQETQQAAAVTLAFPEYQQQFKQALLWALDQHQAAPQGRFAIVVPNLQQQRHYLEKLCSDLAFANPDRLPVQWQDLVNITAGKPLSSYPLCSHLQLLLRAVCSSLHLSEWDVLLKSPFIQGGQSQFELRDRFVLWLQDSNRPQLTWAHIQSQWQRFIEPISSMEQGKPALPVITDSLQAQLNQKRNISQWLIWLQQLLKQFGWLGEFTLDSETYQVNQRLQETLQSLVELDGFVDKLSFHDFNQELNTQLKSTTFQPQTETAPVQIMGTLEAAALNFDGLWVCECESQQWPEPANANPVLPRQTLRKFNMPGSGPERELQYADAMLRGFRTAAPSVIFSWGRYQGDAQLLLSPLLEDLPATTLTESNLITSSREQALYSSREMIHVQPADDSGIPLSQLQTKGGSGLIKSQSLCPFRAYAEYRLGIKQEDELQEGVKASDRGTLVHRVLESFWQQVGSYADLKRLLESDDKLNSCLNSILEHELQRFRKDVYLQPEALYELERQRTFNTVRKWLLEAEEKRLSFTVDTLEKRQIINLSGLELTLTVDRIDQLEDGSRIIIDYKTGLKNTASWLGERPEEPQLPLYALLDNVNTRGIYFGIARPDKTEWQGLQDVNTPFSPKKPGTIKVPEEGWEQQVAQWRLTLEVIAEEYQQGVARVDPLSATTCQFCHLGPVCRIKEQHRDSE